MTTATGELPTDLEACHQLIRELLQSLAEQAHLAEKLQHQLELLLRQRYGRKTETVDPAQLLLFAREILAAAEPPAPEPAPPAEAPPAPASQPKKGGHGRKPLPAHLPRKPILHDVPAERLPCPDCGTMRVRIGEEVREQLEYVPASLIVLQHVRPKYACKCCEGNIVIADRLPEPIEKGLPGPGLMAQVAVGKYADHLPLYRQEGIYRRHGVELPRQTTCGWMAVCADLLEPIYNAMHRLILESEVIQTDDTTLTMLHPTLGKITARVWVYLGDRAHPYTVYHFTEDRSGEGPREMLEGYEGYLQADAFSGYDALFTDGKIVEVGCMMHGRRKFYEARTTDPPRAHQALAWINLLYKVEEEAKEKGFTEAQRYALRREKSRPLLDKLKEWLDHEDQQRVLPKSPIGEAIGYARNHWAALVRYLEAGYLEIDNGASERAMKPVALGRKNWLFAGSAAGGRTAAILMSLCTTCKALGVDPLAYLTDVLNRVSTHPNSRLEELLPDRWQAIRVAAAKAEGGPTDRPAETEDTAG